MDVQAMVDLFAELAKLGRPVIINEFNAAEIYSPLNQGIPYNDTAALQKALASPENAAAASDLANFIELRYAHTFVVREHWIIGPQPRA